MDRSLTASKVHFLRRQVRLTSDQGTIQRAHEDRKRIHRSQKMVSTGHEADNHPVASHRTHRSFFQVATNMLTAIRDGQPLSWLNVEDIDQRGAVDAAATGGSGGEELGESFNAERIDSSGARDRDTRDAFLDGYNESDSSGSGGHTAIAGVVRIADGQSDGVDSDAEMSDSGDGDGGVTVASDGDDKDGDGSDAGIRRAGNNGSSEDDSGAEMTGNSGNIDDDSEAATLSHANEGGRAQLVSWAQGGNPYEEMTGDNDGGESDGVFGMLPTDDDDNDGDISAPNSDSTRLGVGDCDGDGDRTGAGDENMSSVDSAGNAYGDSDADIGSAGTRMIHDDIGLSITSGDEEVVSCNDQTPANTANAIDVVEGRGNGDNNEPSDSSIGAEVGRGETTGAVQLEMSTNIASAIALQMPSNLSSLRSRTMKATVTPAPSTLDELVNSTLDVRFNEEQMTPAKTPTTCGVVRKVKGVDIQNLQSCRQRVGRALLDVLNALPVTKMTPECYEAISSLDSTVSILLDSQFVQELRQLGQVLRSEPVPRLSPECYEAINAMAYSGQVLRMNIVKELQGSGALSFCARPPSVQYRAAPEAQLAELRAAIAACTIATLASSPIDELLALWSVVHTSVSTVITAEAADLAARRMEWRHIGESKGKASSLMRLAIAQGEMIGIEKWTDNEVIDSPVARSIAHQGLTGLNGNFALSREAVDSALQAMREGRAVSLGGWFAAIGLPPLLRIEIVRDFFQVSGLFFSGMYDPVIDFFERQQIPSWICVMIRWLRTVYNALAMDMSVLMQYLDLQNSVWSKVGVSLLLISILVLHAIFLFSVVGLWRHMPRVADEVRHGHEATTWAMFAAKNKWTTRFATILITIYLTAYLPITQMSFNVLVVTGHPEDESAATSVHFASQYQNGPFWFFFPLESIFLIFLFTLPLPFLLVWSIQKNRPSGSLEDEDTTHDLDGEKVKFDDRVYTELVSSDPSQLGCPYRSLYAGFERKWSTYKVIQMVAKVLMAIIVVSAGKFMRVGGMLISGLYLFVVILSYYSEPFIDPLDDKAELFSKCTALLTAVGGMAAAFVEQMGDTSSRSATAIEWLMIIIICAHIANLFVMVVVLLLGMNWARPLIKRLIGWFSFSDTSRGLEDARAIRVLPGWNLQKEAKHRVWQAFWRALLLDLAEKEGSGPQENAKAKDNYSEKKVTGAARLAKLEEAVVASGSHRVHSHWRGKEHAYTAQLRQLARKVLEGVDVYWDDRKGARDGHLDSASCFGKMYAVPYPFHCVVVYDDVEDEAIVRDDVKDNEPLGSTHSNLAKLLFLNFTPEIMAKRELRQKLRALSDQKTQIYFPYSRPEKVWLGPKLLGWKWSIVPRLTWPGTFRFECHYTHGELKVKTKEGKTKRKMAEGFDVTMTYEDGSGEVEVPRDSGRKYSIKNRKAVMKADHIGLEPSMEESDKLRTIFERTRLDWEKGLKNLQKQHQKYRRGLAKVQAEARATLSDDFWYFVYNNPHLARDKLEQYLTEREKNPALQKVPKTHAEALNALYLRRDWVLKHPTITFWFVFWDDLYARNSSMKCLLPADFDPLQPTSICYHVMERSVLTAWLRERNLYRRWILFNPRLLDVLYEQVDKLRTAPPKNTATTRDERKSWIA
ncbi:hypothetical protein BBJ28_00023253 [Nothophytophthora sp. Chile5]|nr:hypothetical protein BBJ28_00023253 [Nothophytophthora sp. Chile5]